MAPSMVGVEGIDRWWVDAGRRGASPASARAIIAAFVMLDVRSVLPEVRVPTLVLHARDNQFVRPNLGHYVADHIARPVAPVRLTRLMTTVPMTTVSGRLGTATMPTVLTGGRNETQCARGRGRGRGPDARRVRQQ
jgi:hypothetical protein